MAQFSKLVITSKGQALIAKTISGAAGVEFTRMATSATQYAIEQLEKLTSISNIKQTADIARVERTNDVAVKVESAFSNVNLTAGYYVKTVGLYAQDPDVGEILYAATIETSGGCYMPAYNGITVSGLNVSLVSTIGNAESVSLTVDDEAYATQKQVRKINEHLEAIDNSIATAEGTHFSVKSCEGGLKINRIYGKSEQISTTGANLWKPLVSQSSNGVTLTVDENGVCTLNGVCTESANLVGSIEGKLSAGTYWLCDNAQGVFPNNAYARTQVYFSTGHILQTENRDASEKAVAITLQEEAGYSMRIRVEKGHTYTNCKLYPMFNKGDKALSWEPYTGGVPSPRPDWPQEIKSVGDSGSVEIKITGANLFDSSIFVDAGWTEANGVYSGYPNVIDTYAKGENFGNIPFKANTQYIISLDGKTDDTSGITAMFGFEYTDGSAWTFFGINSGEFKKFTAVSKEGKTVSRVVATYSYGGKTYIQNMFISEYAEALPCEPYTSQSIVHTLAEPLRGIDNVRDEIDCARGKVVTRFGEVDLGTLDWHSSRKNLFTSYSFFNKALGSAHIIPSILCSHYSAITPAQWYSGQVIGISQFTPGYGPDGALLICDTNYSDADSLKKALSGVKIIYELAEPIETDLTADVIQAICSLKANAPTTRVVSDAHIEVEYGTTNVGGYTLEGLLKAKSNEAKLNELTTAVLALNQE